MANSTATLNPFTGNLQLIQGDAYTYHTVASGTVLKIPANTEYALLCHNLTIEGTLINEGTICTLYEPHPDPNVTVFTTGPQTLGPQHNNHLLAVDTTSGAITINLPALSGILGRTYTIKKIAGSNDITVDPSGSETIDGDTTKAITATYSAMHIIAGPTEWLIG